MKMKTVPQVLDEAQKLRARCTERTFWKYHKLGLLPEGQKIAGKGNVMYYPEDTALRLWFIHFLTKELEFSLSDIARYPWSQFEDAHLVSPLNGIPGELILEAKNQCRQAKRTMLRQLIEKLVQDLKSGTDRDQAVQ